MAGGREEDEEGVSEQQPLLQRAGSSGASSGAQASASAAPAPAGAHSSSASSAAQLKSVASSDCICRICLEDDVPGVNLESPCRCTGTQRWVHPACLQLWVNEKAALTCEICGAPYTRPPGKGAYTAPPPRPPPPPHDALSPEALPQLTRAEREALRRLLTRITLVAPGAGAGGRGAAAHYEVEEEPAEVRPGVSWLLACFLMFLLLLNTGADPSGAVPGGDDAGGGGGGGGGLGPSPGPGAGDDGSSAGAGLVLGLGLFAVWVLAKMCVLTGSLFAAARGWQRADGAGGDEGAGEDVEQGRRRRGTERGFAPGANGGGRGAPANGGGGAAAAADADAAAGAPDVELQRLRAGGRQHPVLVALNALQNHQRRQQLRRAQAAAATAGGDADAAAGAAPPGRLVAIV